MHNDSWKMQQRNSKQMCLHFWMAVTLKPTLSKLSNLLTDSSRPYKQLLQNKKTGSRELFLSEIDFQSSSTVSFPTNI